MAGVIMEPLSGETHNVLMLLTASRERETNSELQGTNLQKQTEQV